jgi:hypothetical protein
MAAYNPIALAVSAVAGQVGASRRISEYTAGTAQVSGFVGGMFSLEGTVDGTEWGPVGEDITDNGFIQVPCPLMDIRVKTIVAPPGGVVPVVKFGGQHVRD